MGYGNCGVDSKDRPIGYAVEAECDHKDCNIEIDRGLSYVCGGMHGGGEYGCGGYFCTNHLISTRVSETEVVDICEKCVAK